MEYYVLLCTFFCMDVIRNKVVGQRLEKLRKRNHLTQCEVARRLGYTQSLVSKVESGERSVPLIELWPYARALEVCPYELAREIHDSLSDAGLE